MSDFPELGIRGVSLTMQKDTEKWESYQLQIEDLEDEIERLRSVLQKIADQSFASSAQIWARQALQDEVES